MKAIDTNIVVRFLTGDDADQTLRVQALFKKAGEEREVLFVTFAAMLETIWALGTIYGVPRDEILNSLEHLLNLPFLRFERREWIEELLRVSPEGSLRPSDLLIGIAARSQGCATTLTFDRKAARSALFTAL